MFYCFVICKSTYASLVHALLHFVYTWLYSNMNLWRMCFTYSWKKYKSQHFRYADIWSRTSVLKVICFKVINKSTLYALVLILKVIFKKLLSYHHFSCHKVESKPYLSSWSRFHVILTLMKVLVTITLYFQDVKSTLIWYCHWWYMFTRSKTFSGFAHGHVYGIIR